MSIDHENPLVDESESEVLQIVSEGLQEASKEATKKHGEELLAHILPVVAGSLSGPLAAGMAAMVAAFIKTVFKKTNVTERKLDHLLAEPFKTATRTVKEVLAEEVRDEAEEFEATRRLREASNQLEKAYTHAEDEMPQKRLLVRVYQCLVAALIEGGGAAMRKHLKELRTLAKAAHEQVQRHLTMADRFKNREMGVVLIERQRYEIAWEDRFEGRMSRRGPTEKQIDSYLTGIENEYRDRAARLEKKAADMESLCMLMEITHKNRRDLLRASK